MNSIAGASFNGRTGDLHSSNGGSIPFASTTHHSGILILFMWFTAGYYAGQQGWNFIQMFIYALGGAFSFAGSFIAYVFGLLL